jgi:D-alanyl-D-alanine carboxypeptidase/D-alanyl-D-alanine-endopeptidase (penicillin-binding protein 4)
MLPLGTRIEAITSASPLDRVHWGVLVVNPRTGDTLYARNPQLPFVPASNMKVPVTHAALALLGPEARWETAFYAAPGAWVGDVVQGDLVLVGSGDPTLGPPFFDDAEEALTALVQTLVDAGVRRVEGRLLVDVSRWDSTTVPSAWMVGNLPTRSAAVGGAFAVGGGDLTLELTGGSAPGAPVSLRVSPHGADAFVLNLVTTGDLGAGEGAASGPPPRAQYLPERRQWIIEGQVPVAGRVTLVQSQRDPVRLAAGALARVMASSGIIFTGGIEDPATPGIPTVIWTPAQAAALGVGPGEAVQSRAPDRPDTTPTLQRIAGLPSPTLIEVSRAILEPSQNWMTEQLVRTLGADRGTRGSWSEGFRVMNALFQDELGVDPIELHWRDGSGLSAYNLISPRALVRILDDGLARPWGAEWIEAMAKPGETGTLRNRLTELNGRVYAKTGSISHVNSLSGFLTREDGELLLFAILTNTGNLPAQDVRDAIDALVREIAR